MNVALILSGGTGSRLGGDIPKQYIEVGGKPIIAYCLETVCSHSDIDVVWVVAEEIWHPLIRRWCSPKLKGFSAPGKTRQLSILNGLVDIRESLTQWMPQGIQKPWETLGISGTPGVLETSGTPETLETLGTLGTSGTSGILGTSGTLGTPETLRAPETAEKLETSESQEVREVAVLIHDAARPLVSSETISACLEGCKSHDGVMPALPVKDTVYYGVDGRIEALLERSKVIAGQAPEAFRLEKYYEATQALLPDDILRINGSTEPAILAGLDVQYIPGDERNFKITTQADLDRFREIVEKGR